jgi:hypothetical protein
MPSIFVNRSIATKKKFRTSIVKEARDISYCMLKDKGRMVMGCKTHKKLSTCRKLISVVGLEIR